MPAGGLFKKREKEEKEKEKEKEAIAVENGADSDSQLNSSAESDKKERSKVGKCETIFLVATKDIVGNEKSLYFAVLHKRKHVVNQFAYLV